MSSPSFPSFPPSWPPVPTGSTAAHPLVPYGWDDGWAAEFAPHAPRGLLPGRVTRVDRSLCDAATPAGPVRADTALVTPRDPLRIVCTGDWVALDPGADRPLVRTILPRRTAVTRSTSSKRSEGQVLATNVDRVVVCVSLAADPDLERLERFLALAMSSSGGEALLRPPGSAGTPGPEPLIVLTKADLVQDADQVRQDVVRAAPGAQVVVVSAATGLGLDALAALASGSSALIGQSGAGKSTLANALLGTAALGFGPTRVDGKGRHTTTTRELLVLPGGGVLIDTPGLRGVGMYESAQGVQQVFTEIQELAADCRFADCGHLAEPGCAVLAALADGLLTERRLDSYRKLLREDARIAARTDHRTKVEQARQRKARSRTGRQSAQVRALHWDEI